MKGYVPECFVSMGCYALKWLCTSVVMSLRCFTHEQLPMNGFAHGSLQLITHAQEVLLLHP